MKQPNEEKLTDAHKFRLEKPDGTEWHDHPRYTGAFRASAAQRRGLICPTRSGCHCTRRRQNSPRAFPERPRGLGAGLPDRRGYGREIRGAGTATSHFGRLVR